MPEGADAVVMVEHTGRGPEGEVCVFNPVYPQQNVGHRAADIATGQITLSYGDLLTPSRLGSIAALSIDQIEVFDRPKVAILSTGNEIIDPGQQLNPGQIYDINRFTLGAIIREHGGVPISHPTPADTLKELETAVQACRNADVLVFSGGSSVGERDLTLDVLEKTGEVLFHGIAVKPGKPTVFGKIGSMPVFGMPGYPTSCLSNAYMLLVPSTSTNLTPTTPSSTDRIDPDCSTYRLDNGTASVLHRSCHQWGSRPSVQGVWRYHKYVEGGWLYRDPCSDGHRGGRRSGRSEALLSIYLVGAAESEPLACSGIHASQRQRPVSSWIASQVPWPTLVLVRRQCVSRSEKQFGGIVP